MEIDLEELRRLAMEATPGPWFVQHGDDECFMNMTAVSTEDRGPGHIGQFQRDAALLAVTFRQLRPYVADELDDCGEANSAYIAAANPAVMHAILDRLEAAEGDAKRYRTIRALGCSFLQFPGGGEGAALDREVDDVIISSAGLCIGCKQEQGKPHLAGCPIEKYV